jgi:hypothetical protein
MAIASALVGMKGTATVNSCFEELQNELMFFVMLSVDKYLL